MGCLEMTEFAYNVILVASKMSSISCLFALNTRIFVNSNCLNITPITRTLGNLLKFSAPAMAKYLEICPFISTKAIKCVIVLKKTLTIYHWALQGGGGGVGGLACVAWLWGGCVAVFIWRGECWLDFVSHFRVSAVCRDLGN